MSDAKTAAPLTPDQAAAHEFLTELRTRITIQPLPYQHGVEARALESLWEIFGHARTAMKSHPGCRKFAAAVTQVLNVEVRPVTAKWHRAYAQGRLASRDGADEFRGDLARLQANLRRFAAQLHEMAYGERANDATTPPAMPAAEIARLFADLPFGIGPGSLIDDDTRKAMNLHEAEAVATRRLIHDVDAPKGMNGVGLALSGGGIRSATFCLGVVQVLACRALLKDVDFLSTVSGGGYTGSFLTTRLGHNQPHTDVAGPYGPDPDAIRYLRQHAKYLAAIGLKQSWSMATAALAGMLLNWSAPLLVIVLAALAAIGYRKSLDQVPWASLVTLSGVVTMAALVFYGWSLRKSPRTARRGGGLLAGLIALSALLTAGWLLDAGYDRLPLANPWKGVWAAVASVIAAGPAILRFVPVVKNPTVRTFVLQGLLLLAGLVIPFGAVALFYVFWHVGGQSSAATLVLLGVAAALALVAMFILNVNLTGPHRLYRDQLARTFIQADEADGAPLPLEQINPQGSAPYHLINATLNVPSSTNVRLRERRSDFFLFSKHWCGSPAMDYFSTAIWKTNNARPDLATAMAISGAAFSSHMGLGSRPTLRALLTFLNVRLGFWIRKPGYTWPSAPGFLCLLREMGGLWMSEDRAWLNLSDGGHLENMAVYELLRRRCKYVICVDGEADPQWGFHGLLTLVRHAQIDFGVRIEPSLTDLRPNAATGYSQTHAALCRLHYPDQSIGLLLYLKLSLTGNETELIRRYRGLHPEFPHQTTLDQFFDEEQFEVYRQLGVHVADGLFARALMGGETAPKSVPQWFRKLAANLLEPTA